jgi:hypothetical protein
MTRQTKIQASDFTLNKLFCGFETVSLRIDSLATANSTFPKGWVSFTKEGFEVSQTLVFQIKFCCKSPALLVGA